MHIQSMADEIGAEAKELRRKLHKMAERSFCEYQTSAFVADYLEKLGLSVRTGVAETGVIAFLDNGKPDTILMRADMDALEIEETTGCSFQSETPGVMHACGHDAHMAVLLCTAKLLTKLKERLYVNVLFVFQPGEETTGGAEPMIQTGILDEFHVIRAVGLHVMNDVETGHILLKKGPMMAAPDDFDVYIYGKGGHGALPHKCVNPIPLSGKIMSDFETIGAQFVSPFAQKVISVCAIDGGATYNIIPDMVHMRGTVRTYDETIRRRLPEQMEKAVAGVCNTYGATYDFQFHFRYPPLINDDTEVERMEQIITEVLGEDCVVIGEEPYMVGEDFSYFAKEVPSVFFVLGSGNKKRGITQPLHSSSFSIDEDCLPVGVAAMVLCAISAR